MFSLSSKADALTYFSTIIKNNGTLPTSVTNNQNLLTTFNTVNSISDTLTFDEFKDAVIQFSIKLNDYLDYEYEYDEAVMLQLILFVLLDKAYTYFNVELDDLKNEGFYQLFKSMY